MPITFEKTTSRIRGVLRNHPRSQYVRLTKDEARSVIDAAPLETLGIDTSAETRKVLARVVHRLMGKTDEVTEFVEEQIRDSRYFDQELARRIETVDRRLATISEMATDARRDLRAGRLPDYFTDHSGFDQLMRELRSSSTYVENNVGGALHYAYLLRNQSKETTDV